MEEKNDLRTCIREKQLDVKELLLFNDDVNTFEYVIETLIEVLEMDPIQAEQITIVVHYKGKGILRSGTYEKLKPLADELLNRYLSVEIQ